MEFQDAIVIIITSGIISMVPVCIILVGVLILGVFGLIPEEPSRCPKTDRPNVVVKGFGKVK